MVQEKKKKHEVQTSYMPKVRARFLNNGRTINGKPGRITNNDSENANNQAKLFQKRQKLPLHESVKKMQQFTESWTRVRQQAMFSIDNSVAVVSPFFKPFRKSKLEYDTMSWEKRREHVEKIFPGSFLLGEKHVEVESSESASLSISYNESGLYFFSQESLRKCWMDAAVLLAKNRVGGYGDESKIIPVMDGTTHDVQMKEDGSFECSRYCKRVKYFKGLLCPHVLAAAEKRQKLPEFIQFCHQYQQKSKNLD